jgi:uncharacterized protein (TIGR02271 family)
MATSRKIDKTDLPPTGDRNPDPITDQAGAHPIETGVGAALGGAAAGAAGGAFAGPVGAAVGAVIGAVAGGLAGKGVGESIDPTVDDDYLESNFSSRPYVRKGESFETYRDAYRHGGRAVDQYRGKSFDEVQDYVRQGWEKSEQGAKMKWDHAKEAVRDAYDRTTHLYNERTGEGTMELREERLHVDKTPVEAGSARLRKEVVTENRTVEVPVEREELVIERRPASGRAHGAIAGNETEEIRIPLKEERVNVSKDTVVTEEVSVGKRKVKDTEIVSGTVRHEELKVDETCDPGKPRRKA